MLGMIIGAAVATKIVGKAVVDIADNVNKNQIMTGRRGQYVPEGSIYAGVNSEELIGKDYRQVINILKGAGFTNINTAEIREYKNKPRFQKYFGTVTSVAINGNESFRQNKIFPKSSYVRVSFHVFRDSPSTVIPELQSSKISDVLKWSGQYTESAVQEEEFFCEYCDCRIDKEWHVCAHCGAPINYRALRQKR